MKHEWPMTEEIALWAEERRKLRKQEAITFFAILFGIPTVFFIFLALL